jgi:hypothetical protein
MSSLIEDLRTQIEKGSVLVVVGAGISVAATRRNALASWTGLLKHGVSRCVDVATALPEGWAERVNAQIDSNDPLEMVSAAENISQRLGYPEGGVYRKWLRESVGSLELLEPATIEAIANLNVPIATTNYDGLITKVTGRRPVTWTDRALTQRWLRNDEEGVLHLHGYWEIPQSVILGVSSYEDILRDEHTQALLKSCLLVRTMLFVGFGAGLADPNFTALLDWDRRVLAQSEYFHYRLALNKDVAELRRQNPSDQRVFILGYGDTYESLVPFLQGLGCAPSTPSIPPSDLQQFTEGRADIDRRRSILDSKKGSISPQKYLHELSRIAFDLAQIGGVRSAWMMLAHPFLENAQNLDSPQRIDTGLKLSQLLLDDDSAGSARQVLEKILPDIEALHDDDATVFSFWHLRSRCFVQLCVYDEAVNSLELTACVAPDDESQARVAADVAELHFLQSDIDKAFATSKQAMDS